MSLRYRVIRRRLPKVLLVAACLSGALFGCARRKVPSEKTEQAAGTACAPAEAPPEASDNVSHIPTGAPPRLSCAQARKIVAHVRHELPFVAATPDPSEFAEFWIGWFDPHGLWSAAPDSKLASLAHSAAPALIAELEKPASDASPCRGAEALANAAKVWIDGLRTHFEETRLKARPRSLREAYELASMPLFDQYPVERPAYEIVRDLATSIASFATVFPELSDRHGVKAFDHFLPALSQTEWLEVTLAAAVRAYVPAIDPHGEWAPVEEQWSLFGGDPLLDRQPGLWSEMRRTALGVRIVSEPRAPLNIDDLVLSIDGVTTAGLSVEQVEQLARIEPENESEPRRISVLRAGSDKALELSVGNGRSSEIEMPPLAPEFVPYGSGRALIIPVEDIADDLGQQLASVITTAKAAHTPLGILLDLRGNGGGSTDGAQAAIGLFLPGAPSFPLLHRGHVQEVLRALEPDQAARWAGPLAVLVDGETASAAEMIAGAIGAYGRGDILGRHTFGKGCIQEYFEDPASVGILRLTTLLVALPNGAPLQRTGIEPTLRLPLPEPPETEADLPASPAAVGGPDVRDPRSMGGVEWPAHGGKIGPCADKFVCVALSRLGQRANGLRRSRNVQNAPSVRAHRARSPRPVLGQAEHSVHGIVQSRSGRGPAFGR